MELKLDLETPLALLFGFYFKDSVDLVFRVGIRLLSVWHFYFLICGRIHFLGVNPRS
jgi:fatty-acid desaturase